MGWQHAQISYEVQVYIPPCGLEHFVEDTMASSIDMQSCCDPKLPGLLLQPDSRPISKDQLAFEVKSIYSGLTMVENRCIQVDLAQLAAEQDPDSSKIEPVDWQALIALHRTLLHEHHDFFLTLQHHSASPELRWLAAKYPIPEGMGKPGVRFFLELLRQQPLEGTDYMLSFIYLAYQVMALTSETGPAYQYSAFECVSDDLMRLTEGLAQLLKTHCAPMRDELVDKMVDRVKTGVFEKNHGAIISGLRQFFGILEAMKLVSLSTCKVLALPNKFKDVANHQIRNLRLGLIEDTIKFEHLFHFRQQDGTPYNRDDQTIEKEVQDRETWDAMARQTWLNSRWVSPSSHELLSTTLDFLQQAHWWRRVGEDVHRTIERLERELCSIAFLRKR